MKRRIFTLIIIAICFLLESTVFDALSFGGVCPNLLIIVTASFAFMRGQKSGMYVGLMCGLLADLFWGSVLGLNMLIFLVIGYLIGGFQRLFYDDDIVLPVGLTAVSEIIYGTATYVCLYMLKGDFAFRTYLFSIIIPELVYTILVTLVLYQIILYINQKLEAEEQRSASKFV